MAISKRSFALAAIVLVAIIGIAASFRIADVKDIFTSQHPVSCDNPGNNPSEWIGISFMALAFGALVLGLAWIFGGLFGAQKYNDFLRIRMWELVETAAILSIFSLAFQILLETGINNIDTARTYAAITRNTIAYDFGLIVMTSTFLSFLTKQSPQLRPNKQLGAFAFSFQLAPAFRPIFDILGNLVQMMAAAIAEWYAHEFLLCFVKNSMLTMLLPLGILLRALGVKGGGNALIGVAIAMYFFYPFMMVKTGELLSGYFENQIVNDPSPLYPHPWSNGPNCLGDRPICCFTGDHSVSDLSVPHIPNGASTLSQQAILHGDMTLTAGLSAAPSDPNNAFCVYNTYFARAFGIFSAMWQTLGYATPVLAIAGVVGLGTLLGAAGISSIVMMVLPGVLMISLYAINEVVFFVFIISMVLPIFMVFITITLAKEIAKMLGTEIDLSSLEKLI